MDEQQTGQVERRQANTGGAANAAEHSSPLIFHALSFIKGVTGRRPYLDLVIILTIFLVLAGLHSLIVPLTQGEDELAHYRYLSFIAQTGRLPINAQEREQAWYRADWPPLYHLLVGWAVSPLDMSRPPLKDVGESPHRRLAGQIFYPRLIIYTEDANWPWQDGVLAWHLGRFISILFAAGALVLTYLTAVGICRGVEEQRSRGAGVQRSRGAEEQRSRGAEEQPLHEASHGSRSESSFSSLPLSYNKGGFSETGMLAKKIGDSTTGVRPPQPPTGGSRGQGSDFTYLRASLSVDVSRLCRRVPPGGGVGGPTPAAQRPGRRRQNQVSDGSQTLFRDPIARQTLFALPWKQGFRDKGVPKQSLGTRGNQVCQKSTLVSGEPGSRGAGRQPLHETSHGSSGESSSPPHPRTLAPLHPRTPAPLLPLAATALLAFHPRFIFTSSMLGDDALFILLSAGFIWLLLRALRGDDRWGVYGLMGLLLGFSIATKYSTGLLPLAILPVALWRAWQADWRRRQWVGRVAVSWAAVLVGAGWWFGWIGYYFNTVREDGLFFGLLSPLLNTGPDVSMRRIFALFSGGQFTGPERPEAIAAGTFGDWWVYLFQTFWGVPVLEQDPLFPAAYLVVLIFCLAAAVGLWQLWRSAGGQTRMTLTVLLSIIILLFPFPILRFFLTRNIPETGQGRHILYPAAQAIPILLMWGWLTACRRLSAIKRWLSIKSNHAPKAKDQASKTTSYVLRPTSYVFLPPLILLAWSIFQLVYMNLTYPPPLPVRTTTFAAQTIPQPDAYTFGRTVELLGYDFRRDPAGAEADLTLFWQALKPAPENYRVQIQLVDSQGRPRFTWLGHPANGLYPTRAWDAGDVIRDEISLPLATLPPGRYAVHLNLLRQAEDTALRDAPVAITQFDLSERRSLVGANRLYKFTYRLQVEDVPARHRQTLLLLWSEPEQPATDAPSSQNPTWSLRGPDGKLRYPATVSDQAGIFIVEGDWPSGDYRLHLIYGGREFQTEPVVTIANALRQFDLPADIPGWTPVEAGFAVAPEPAQVKLLGYTLPTRRVEAGGTLPLTLYWQSLRPVLDELVTFTVLLDVEQQAYGSVDRYPSGFYSPILWTAGEIVSDSFAVPVQPDAPPGVYHLHVGQYRLVDQQPDYLTLTHAGQATDETAVVIGPIKVGGPPPGTTTTAPEPQVILNQPVGDQITLIGYDLTGPNGQPLGQGQGEGQNRPEMETLKATLYWRAEADLQTDYTTFRHLRDAAGETASQNDSVPAAGRYPTSLWEAGEIIVDEAVLPLDDLPPGQYTPVVGLYEVNTGDRLPTPGLSANEIRLSTIQLGGRNR